MPLGLMVGTAASPASAATTHVVTSYDQWGDVRSTAAKRLTLREKRSIDMGRVTVDRVDRKAGSRSASARSFGCRGSTRCSS
jgi:hypothetical protein